MASQTLVFYERPEFTPKVTFEPLTNTSDTFALRIEDHGAPYNGDMITFLMTFANLSTLVSELFRQWVEFQTLHRVTPEVLAEQREAELASTIRDY